MTDTSNPEFDARSVDDLINAALTEQDEVLAWEAVCALHWRGSQEVLERAQALCTSNCQQERRVGADLLGQLGVPERTFPQETIRLLFSMLELEDDPAVLQSIFVAFSHNEVPEVVIVAARYASHPDPDVRHAVVLAVSGYDDDQAVQLLIQMCDDFEPQVRDWATFGLGTQVKLDTAEIRNALAARLDDPDDHTRGEAMIGLARRNDARAIPAIRKDLKALATEKALDAAALSRSPELLPELNALRDLPNMPTEFLDEVIAECTPP